MENTIQSLEKVTQMAEEMEDNYKEKMEILQLQVEDACGLVERYILENEKLIHQLEKHNERNKIYMALYILLFVYGLVYGAYVKSHEQEL
jgi:hypothetical protein